MTDDCGCRSAQTDTSGQRRVLKIALALNVMMFVIGLVAGVAGRSSGLIADALDMLADAVAYAVALVAIGRSASFKGRAGMISGSLLLFLGALVLVDVARRSSGNDVPASGFMLVVASLSLAVNVTVLRLLGRYRDGEAHLRATWLFTRVDVIANVAVIVSGLIVLMTGWRYLDLAVGACIGLYVIKEAIEIIRDGRDASSAVAESSVQ